MKSPRKLGRIWRPEEYQGGRRKRRYFEGWYFKSVSADGNAAVSIIPGISLTRDRSRSHAFVQVLEGQSGRAQYHRYAIDDFATSSRPFEVRIGQNRFSLSGIQLDIRRPEGRIEGKLRFRDVHTWPVHLLSPGIMGPFRFLPGMECYHGVLSLNHSIVGSLTLNNAASDFGGGKGYIEKDWGRSMPSAWIWMQTNNFDEADVSLTASVARIPYLWWSFTGFIIGLWQGGRLLQFTTYTGSRLKEVEVTEQSVLLRVENREYCLELRARRERGSALPSPVSGAMTGRVSETLSSEVQVRLVRRTHVGGQLMFEGTGRHAGLEVSGDADALAPGPTSRSAIG